MNKNIIKLSESDLINIIKKVLNEQSVTASQPYFKNRGVNSTDNTRVSPNYVTPPKPVTPKGFECVPKLFQAPVSDLKSKGYNPLFLKAALGVIGRESSFGSGNRFEYLNPLKTLWANLGGSASVGYGQIKPDVAEKYGINIDDLNTALGSLATVHKILIDNYNKAREVGFNGAPSVNVKNGTGNAALDMAIVAYNSGVAKIVKYCETSNPEIKRDCKLAGKVINEELLEQSVVGAPNYGVSNNTPKPKPKTITVYNKPVINYVPNFKTKRWDGVEISSHGYVQEVANKIKKYTCFS